MFVLNFTPCRNGSGHASKGSLVCRLGAMVAHRSCKAGVKGSSPLVGSSLTNVVDVPKM